MTKPLKNKLIYPLIGFLIFITIMICAVFYFDRLASKPVKIKELKIDTKAALKLNILQQISKKNGIKEWELKAASATLLKDKNRAVLVDVSIIFFTKEAKKVLLKANRGILNTKTHDIVFSDNVVVNYETSILKTDKLHYNKKKTYDIF
jgi:LPS export ABC transporter protein LptC